MCMHSHKLEFACSDGSIVNLAQYTLAYYMGIVPTTPSLCGMLRTRCLPQYFCHLIFYELFQNVLHLL